MRAVCGLVFGVVIWWKWESFSVGKVAAGRANAPREDCSPRSAMRALVSLPNHPIFGAKVINYATLGVR